MCVRARFVYMYLVCFCAWVCVLLERVCLREHASVPVYVCYVSVLDERAVCYVNVLDERAYPVPK